MGRRAAILRLLRKAVLGNRGPAVGADSKDTEMQIAYPAIPGLLRITPDRRGDARGYFAETFRSDMFAAEVGETVFVQDNESLSARAGTIRGLHFQTAPFAQGKLVRCVQGALLDVAVDIRHGSPTFGRWVALELSAENGHQLWLPPGFAHGFCTLQPNTMISYKVTACYSAEHDKGLAWDDPAIGVTWPDCADRETLSAKDRVQPKLADLPAYFAFEG
jgi:dTDP-4-dehydrorhamnose 3,5-epimerase